MSDKELKQYFLRHREDKAALRAYLDRASDRPCNIITTVNDPDFDAKIQAAILRQMQGAFHSKHRVLIGNSFGSR